MKLSAPLSGLAICAVAALAFSAIGGWRAGVVMALGMAAVSIPVLCVAEILAEVRRPLAIAARALLIVALFLAFGLLVRTEVVVVVAIVSFVMASGLAADVVYTGIALRRERRVALEHARRELPSLLPTRRETEDHAGAGGNRRDE